MYSLSWDMTEILPAFQSPYVGKLVQVALPNTYYGVVVVHDTNNWLWAAWIANSKESAVSAYHSLLDRVESTQSHTLATPHSIGGDLSYVTDKTVVEILETIETEPQNLVDVDLFKSAQVGSSIEEGFYL